MIRVLFAQNIIMNIPKDKGGTRIVDNVTMYPDLSKSQA